MSWFLAGISALFLGSQAIKEAKQPVIPASYWRNKELMNQDKLNPAISPDQVMENLRNGKYYLSDAEMERRQKAEQANKDYSFREGENINAWMLRMSQERNERMRRVLSGKN